MGDYPSQWRANSARAGDKSGVGTFKVEGMTYSFALNDFADFHRIGRALDAAFTSGLTQGKVIAAAKMRRTADELDPASEVSGNG